MLFAEAETASYRNNEAGSLPRQIESCLGSAVGDRVGVRVGDGVSVGRGMPGWASCACGMARVGTAAGEAWGWQPLKKKIPIRRKMRSLFNLYQ
jgi:hypothetical protein